MNGSPNRFAPQSQFRFPLMEVLEDRRLLSGTTCPVAANLATGSPATTVSLAVRAPLAATPAVKITSAKAKKPVATTSPSLVLDYKGTLRGRIPQTLGIFTTPFEFNITAQTLTSVTGKATIAGRGANGKMKGKLLSNGNFVYRFAAKGVIFGITGHVRPDGQVITGTASLQVLVGSRIRITGNYAAKAATAT